MGRVFAVGGAVRDSLLGVESPDLDLCVEMPGGARAFTAWVHERWREETHSPHELGAGYPIWQLAFRDGGEVQVADTQAECFPDPTTRQRVTVYGDLDADCRRRDFTTNMLYRELGSGRVLDPSGRGLEDLKSGILRGHPAVDLAKTFSDDPLRILRLFRFRARFGWKIPEEVLAKARAGAPRLPILSGERVRDELVKMCVHDGFPEALEGMRQVGALDVLLPELLAMRGCGQDATYHSEGDVWTHTLLVVRNSPPRPLLRLAALFHDLGKPSTRSEQGGRVKFLEHEKASEKMTREILSRLRFPKDLSEGILRLVALHLRGGDVQGWASLKPARKLLRDADGLLDDLLDLIEADSKSSLGPDGEPRVEHLPVLRAKLAEAALVPVNRKPVLDGRDLMRLTGLPPGRELGRLRDALMEFEDDFVSREARAPTREEAEAWLTSTRAENAG
jgi:poly(A) polymerase